MRKIFEQQPTTSVQFRGQEARRVEIMKNNSVHAAKFQAM